jgi:O-acetyl-ADP-ribose deacetylase (regulator of RNase III)
MGHLSLVLGDITAQHVDAIVNAANTRMRGGGGVDGAIHRAGGPEVLEDCIRRFPNGLPTGKAGWTTAGGLPARWIIHAVGPNYNAGQRDPELLASCYREALRIADELGARSIAFPAISAGIYGWPLESAAEIAVNMVASTPHGVADVRFVLLTQDVYDAFAGALAARGDP